LWWKQTGPRARLGVPRAFLSRFRSWGVFDLISLRRRVENTQIAITSPKNLLSVFRKDAPKTPMAITLPKIAPKASSWTQKMRLGILHNLYAKSGAEKIFGEVMAIWVFSTSVPTAVVVCYTKISTKFNLLLTCYGPLNYKDLYLIMRTIAKF
jgi:hypothetical protein